MNIIWSANAIWCHTGYGVQGRYLLPRMARMGHRPYNFAWYGLEGGEVTVKVGDAPITILPKGLANWGEDCLGYYCERHDIDLVISLQDVWVLPQDYHTAFDPAWACWFPVDHNPLPARVLNVARTADYPMTYSQWGRDVAAQSGLETTYIPHAVDTSLFNPGDQTEARKALGWPQGAYIIGMVAANKGFPSRKSFPEAMTAFAIFRREHPEIDAHLYLHTTYTVARRGVDLLALSKSLGIEKHVMFPNGRAYQAGLPDDYMVDLYRAMDCMLLPSMTEGFGIPLIEAQACGIPVVTNDYGPMAELCFNGVAVQPGQPWWSPLNSWYVTANIKNVLNGLEEVAGWDSQTRLDNAIAGVEKIQAEYDWDVVSDTYWKPFLERVEAEQSERRQVLEPQVIEPCA